MSLAILFHFLCAQHVSNINISIIRSMRLYCWITTLVVLFLVRCVLELRCGWFGVVSVLQAEASAWCHLLFYFTSHVGWSGIRVEGWSFIFVSLAILFHFSCGLEWYPCCRLKLQLCVTCYFISLLMWVGVVSVLQAEASALCHLLFYFTSHVGWSGIRFAGWSFSLQHGYHSKPTTAKLQHTSNQEQYDQCGNSTE